ncbi:MAG: hypothetical protein WC955_05425 [Elusimicrobiota bacterium]
MEFLVTKQDINEFRVSTKKEFDELRKEFMESEKRLFREIQSTKSELVRWTFMFILGQTGVLLAYISYLVK